MGFDRRTNLAEMLCGACVLMTAACGTALAESIVLDDTLTVFDGSIFGGNGCDGEFPLASCKYYNMGGFAVFDVGKNIRHGSSEWRTLLGFDISGLSNCGDIQIDSAILTLTVCYAVDPDSILYIGVRSLKFSVIEGTAQAYRNADDSSFTWSARIFKDEVDTVSWQVAGVNGAEDREDSIYAVSPGMGSAGVYRIDMTGLLRHWIDSSATERWCLLADSSEVAAPYARKIFHSSECSIQSQRPKLEIFYTNPGQADRCRHNVLAGGLLR